MKTTVRPTGPLERCLHVEVDAEEISSEVAQEVKRLAANVKLPGFRKGTVPTSLIRERYGAGILQEIREKRLTGSLDQAIKAEELQLMHIAGFTNGSKLHDEKIEYLVDLVVQPKLLVSEIESLSIVKPVVEFSDEEVDKQVDAVVPVGPFQPQDREVREGDEVQFLVTDIGTEHTDESNDRLTKFDSKLEGSQSVVLDGSYAWADPWKTFICESLRGQKAGDTFVVERDISLDDHIEAARKGSVEVSEDGADADSEEQSETADSEVDENDNPTIDDTDIARPYLSKLHVEINITATGIRPKPTIDDEFVQANFEGFQSAEELRSGVLERMQEQVESFIEGLINTQISNQMIAMNPVELPHDMLESRAAEGITGRGMSSDEESNGDTSGTPTNEDVESQRKQALGECIVDQYAESHGIEADIVSMNELLNNQYAMYKRLGLDTEILHTREHQQRVHRSILSENVYKHIYEQAPLEEEVVSFKELNSLEFAEKLASRQPSGGPFEWESPVSESDIKIGRQESDKLRESFTADTDETLSNEEGEVSEESKEGGVKKVWNKLVGIFSQSKGKFGANDEQ